RARRQRRGGQARRHRRRQRRQDRRISQRAGPARRLGVRPLRPQPVRLPRNPGRQEGQGARRRLERRDRPSHRAHPRRRRRSPEFHAETRGLRNTAMDHLPPAVDPFVFRFSIFILAVFVGYYVVWSVTPALHTPLMSVTNAISSVIVVGALLAVGVSVVADDSGPVWARALGFVALILASVNIFGGFLVTQRMLAMYQKKKK